MRKHHYTTTFVRRNSEVIQEELLAAAALPPFFVPPALFLALPAEVLLPAAFLLVPLVAAPLDAAPLVLLGDTLLEEAFAAPPVDFILAPPVVEAAFFLVTPAALVLPPALDLPPLEALLPELPPSCADGLVGFFDCFLGELFAAGESALVGDLALLLVVATFLVPSDLERVEADLELPEALALPPAFVPLCLEGEADFSFSSPTVFLLVFFFLAPPALLLLPLASALRRNDPEAPDPATNCQIVNYFYILIL